MPKIKVRQRIVSPIWLHERELGFRKRLGFEDRFCKTLYSSLLPCTSWDHHQLITNKIHGGVFNLEFSPDGSLLVAACEKKSILMFDPLTRKLIYSVGDAHGDCVNCVRFLDSRTFATCSDDCTVVLWDARNLKYRTRTLYGHSNWVKNIEYSPKDDLLVTSGFDGSIYTWDINCYTEHSLTYKRVFHTNGLMRTRLSPNSSKMVICTTGGYLILIHNLDLKTLAHDLQGFKPNMYRLMQLSQQSIPVATNFSHLFSSKRKTNRVEFITDFPTGDDAEVMSSLQIHPMGWCCLSRNISSDENSEWTCVHDIQERSPQEVEKFETEIAKENDLLNSQNDRQGSSIHIDSESRASVIPFENEQTNQSTSRTGSTPGPDLRLSSADVWEALIAVRESRIRRDLVSSNPEGNFNFNNMQRIASTTTGILAPNGIIESNLEDAETEIDEPDAETEIDEPSSPAPSTSSAVSKPSSSGTSSQRNRRAKIKKRTALRIYKNFPRLTHFIDEPNVGKGFIKELCFSPDGRLICSPFGYGIRLLAFSPECSEMSTCLPNESPVRLFELGTNVCHSDIVVSSKFSPKHQLLVTGCLSGKIVWHQPVL